MSSGALLNRLLVLALLALALLMLNIFAARLPMPALAVVWALLALPIAAGLWVRARSRRQAFLQAYIHERSPLRRWLAGRLWLRGWQLVLAVPLALVLLTGVARLSQGPVWSLLLVSLPALALLQALMERVLRRHVTAAYLPALSWRITLWLAFLLLWGLLAAVALHQSYPDFADIPLATALWHEASLEQAASTPLLWLLQAAAMKDALVWWLGQQVLPGVGDNLLRLAGWLVLLAVEGLFLLAFLQLAAGALTLAAPRQRQGRLGAGVCLLLVGLVVLVADQRALWRAQWQPAPPVTVALGGDYYRVSPEQASSLALLSTLQVSGGEARAREQIRGQLQQGLDQVFDDLARRLPVFADWYYSLGGEYARLSMMALEKADLVDGNYLEDKARELIFEAVGYDDRMAMLRRQGNSVLVREARATQAAWLAEVLARLGDQVPLPGPPAGDGGLLSLDEALAAMQGYGDPAFVQRTAVASGVATATAGAVMLRGFARRATARSAAALAARGAARGAAGATAGAGTGAAVCAPSGPGALACAVIGGVAAWVATDFALLKFDEYRNRDELIADLQAALEEERSQAEARLHSAYEAVIARQYGAMQEDIARTFRPLQSR